MARYYLGGDGPSFICYVWAHNDPQWREQNGLPPKKPKREYPVPKTEQRRKAREAKP